jgi:hypothetical protein
MANLLLSLALVVTQFLSWGAAPRFLCVSDDGSVCIDAGPQACGCCHDEHAEHAVAGCDQRHHDDHALVCDATPHWTDATHALALSDPCECRHIELSAVCAPAIVRGSERSHSDQSGALPAAAHAATPLLPVDASLVVAEVAAPPGSTLYLSSILGSVVLRC